MMVEDGDLEILKLFIYFFKIAQGEVYNSYKGEADLLEENYLKIISLKTAALSAATRVGACIAGLDKKKKEALESYGKNIGLAFQIADDALDYFFKKNFWKEIEKISFIQGYLPIIIVFQKPTRLRGL